MRNIWVKLFWPKIRPFQKELRFFFNIQTMNFPFCEKCSCVLQEIWNFAGRKYTLKNCANPHFKWRSHRGRTYFATGPELWIRWKTHWVRWWTTSWPSACCCLLAARGSSPRLDLHLTAWCHSSLSLKYWTPWCYIFFSQPYIIPFLCFLIPAFTYDGFLYLLMKVETEIWSIFVWSKICSVWVLVSCCYILGVDQPGDDWPHLLLHRDCAQVQVAAGAQAHQGLPGSMICLLQNVNFSSYPISAGCLPLPPPWLPTGRLPRHLTCFPSTSSSLPSFPSIWLDRQWFPIVCVSSKLKPPDNMSFWPTIISTICTVILVITLYVSDSNKEWWFLEILLLFIILSYSIFDKAQSVRSLVTQS